MTNKTLLGLAAFALVSTTAIAPLCAADMTFERALNADQEPQNWLLHHKNYQGHRFSQLKEIDTTTVARLKLAFTVGLGGMEAGVKHVNGNLEATPLVDDGVMYVTDGWGSVYAIDVGSGKKGVIRWKFNPEVDRVWAGDVACCGVNNRGVALWKDKIIAAALDGRLFALNRATGEKIWERKVAARPAASTASAAGSTRPTSTPASKPGAPSRFRARASPATRPGRTARTAGCTAADRSGSPRPTTATPTRSTRASAMPVPTTTQNTARRQQVGGQRAGARSRQRQDQMGLPVHAQRSLRL
jgi:glucose dehydrogenase